MKEFAGRPGPLFFVVGKILFLSCCTPVNWLYYFFLALLAHVGRLLLLLVRFVPRFKWVIRIAEPGCSPLKWRNANWSSIDWPSGDSNLCHIIYNFIYSKYKLFYVPCAFIPALSIPCGCWSVLLGIVQLQLFGCQNESVRLAFRPSKSEASN